MISVDTAQDLAVLWTLDFDAELPCESEHSDPTNLICAGKATHVAKFICTEGTVAGCVNYANYVKSCIAAFSTCRMCQGACSECWSIRPI